MCLAEPWPIESYASIRFIRMLMTALVQWALPLLIGMRMASLEKMSV